MTERPCGCCVLMENWSMAVTPSPLCLIAMNDLSVVTSASGRDSSVWKSTSAADVAWSHDLGRTTVALMPATPRSTSWNAMHRAVPGSTDRDSAAAPGIRRSSRRTWPATPRKQRTPEMESARLYWDTRR